MGYDIDYSGLDVSYSYGPRYIDGVNIDLDANATIDIQSVSRHISDSVTGLAGYGYEPGQIDDKGGEV